MTNFSHGGMDRRLLCIKFGHKNEQEAAEFFQIFLNFCNFFRNFDFFFEIVKILSKKSQKFIKFPKFRPQIDNKSSFSIDFAKKTVIFLRLQRNKFRRFYLIFMYKLGINWSRSTENAKFFAPSARFIKTDGIGWD